MLTQKQEQFLHRASSRYRHAIVIGLVLCVAGGFYGLWAVQQMDPARVPHPDKAWDRPMARLALLAAESQERMDRFRPQTEREESLLRHLKTQTDATVRLILLLFRFVFASTVVTAGVVLLAVGLTQKQFLDITGKLRNPAASGTSVAVSPGRPLRPR
jgi:hypothetical protein